MLIHAEPRQPQAPRTVDKPLLQHRAQDGKAFQQRCRTACAGAADAPLALAPLAQDWQAPCVAQRPIRPPTLGPAGAPRPRHAP